MICRVLTTLAVFLGPLSAHADDKATADLLFVRAKDLAAAGRTAEACPLYAASFRADPQLGALLNLAACHETVGRTASAWAEFREAIELADRRSDARADYARRRATALEAKLVRLRVTAPAIPGLVVSRGDVEITAVLGDAIAVDPGAYALHAEAPGRAPWSGTIEITESVPLAEVAVPPLALAAPTSVVVVAPTAPAPPPRAPAPPRSYRRLWAYAIGGVGLGAGLTGLGFGIHAYREWSASRSADQCDTSNVCSESGSAHVRAARSSARASTYLVGGGGALVVGAAILLLTAPSSIMPMVDEHSAGVAYGTEF